MYSHDKRILITLDAGGTNLVFGAMQSNRPIVEEITLPSNAGNLDRCLATITEGFKMIIDRLESPPAAISFAFPGPADYPNGIIGGYLPNFPSFRDGVALGPMLEAAFGVPVFINNDGDLFAYGEALAGALPRINARLEAAGSPKRYKNLIGYTLGTGFGIGVVIDGRLNRGDNSCVEIFCLRHKKLPGVIVEEGASIRAVKRVYNDLAHKAADSRGEADNRGAADSSAEDGSCAEEGQTLEPKEIFEIAEGLRPGDAEAARQAFAQMGEIAGDAMATAVTIIDGLIVIGGGITAAKKYFMPALLAEMRSTMHTISGEELNRVQMKVYDLDDAAQFEAFARGERRSLQVYGTDRCVDYDPQKRIGIMISEMGASRAIAVGAYAFALNRLDAQK